MPANAGKPFMSVAALISNQKSPSPLLATKVFFFLVALPPHEEFGILSAKDADTLFSSLPN